MAAIVGVLIVCGVLIYEGLKAMKVLQSDLEYFTAASIMSSQRTHDAIGTTWIMLGNVIVANMLIGQLVGVASLWMLLTWLWAFLLLSRHVPAIRDRVQEGETLHGFLRRIYGSREMQIVAAAITVCVAVGVFAVEVLIGTALLVPFFPGAQTLTSAFILILVVVIGMCTAVITGGLRSIINSDSALWPIVIVGVTLLCLISIFSAVLEKGPNIITQITYLPPNFGKWELAAFLVGLFLLQVPLLLCDYGTWQRIRATTLDEKVILARKVCWLGLWQFLIWGLPVLAGMIIAILPTISTGLSADFSGAAGPLIETLQHWFTAAGVSIFVKAAIGLIIVVGLLAVLVTTADGYLLIALEAWVRDFRPDSPDIRTQRMRILAASFAVLGCVPAIMFIWIGGNLLGIISTFFGAQVALAPATVIALYEPEQAQKWSRFICWGTLAGFASTLVFGCFLTYASVFLSFEPSYAIAATWLSTYGVFLAPVPAFLFPATVVSLIFICQGRLSLWGRFSSRLFIPSGPETS